MWRRGSIQHAPRFAMCIVQRGEIACAFDTIVDVVNQLTALTIVVQLTTVSPTPFCHTSENKDAQE